MLFSRADRDGNGKVTREELEAFFKAADSGGQGFLSLSDLQEAFAPPPSAPGPASGRPSKATLVRGLFRQEIGSLQPGPKLDEQRARLHAQDQRRQGRGHPLEADRPQAGRPGLRQLHLRAVPQPDRQHREALPALQGPRDVRDGLRPRGPSDRRLADGRATTAPWSAWRRPSPAPTTSVPGSRRRAAGLLGLGFPMLVDTIDDTVGNRYSGMPGRLYVIDREGKIAFKSGRGPYLFKPAELEQSLVLLLNEDVSKGREARVSPPTNNEPPSASCLPRRACPRQNDCPLLGRVLSPCALHDIPEGPSFLMAWRIRERNAGQVSVRRSCLAQP